MAQTVTDPATLAQYDTVAELLEQAGLSADSIIMAITMLDTLCLGAALDLGAPSVIWDHSGRDTALTRASTGATPGVDRPQHAFEVQLSLIVDALSRQLATERASAPEAPS